MTCPRQCRSSNTWPCQSAVCSVQSGRVYSKVRGGHHTMVVSILALGLDAKVSSGCVHDR
eukprot:4735382-Pleurochrysis_carterae.AAC.6